MKYLKDKCGPFDTCISIGDDYDDESMFREFPEKININIKVGRGRPTSATFHLAEPSSVAVFLQHVWDVCEIGHELRTVDTVAQICRAGG